MAELLNKFRKGEKPKEAPAAPSYLDQNVAGLKEGMGEIGQAIKYGATSAVEDAQKYVPEVAKTMAYGDRENPYLKDLPLNIAEGATGAIKDVGHAVGQIPKALAEGTGALIKGAGEAATAAKGWMDENPNFVIGATPVLMGLLTGYQQEGAEYGAKGLIDKYNADEEKGKEERSAERQRQMASDPLVKVVDPITGESVYMKRSLAAGEKVPEKGFQLDDKKALARYNLGLKKQLAAHKAGLDKKVGGGGFKDEMSLRKEYNQDPITKNTKAMTQSFNDIQTLSSKPQTAANDMAMVFKIMKMLDPTSVVRESEYRTAANSGSVPENIRNQYNRLLKFKDQKLDPAVRDKFFGMSRDLYESQVSVQNEVDATYKRYAKEYDLDTGRIVTTPQVPVSYEPRVEGEVQGGDVVEQDGVKYYFTGKDYIEIKE